MPLSTPPAPGWRCIRSKNWPPTFRRRFRPRAGFGGITLGHCVRTQAEVATVLAQAERAGGRIIKPAQDVFWGGHSGYFSDPDGYYWEVAWNPVAPLDADGFMQLPP